MELDKHKLEEERRWRLQNYQDQVKRLVTSIVDAIQQEAKRTLEREIRYDDDIREEYTYVDQAGQLQHAILQAVNNSDFGGLTRDAGDLHAVEMALFTLWKLKEGLPSETRALLEGNENAALQERIDVKVARIEELEAKDRDDCVAAVSGGMGFHRCNNKGKETFIVDGRPGYLGTVVPADDPNAIEVKVCGVHAKDARRGRLHVHRPSDWDETQRLGWRQQQAREIAAMQRQLAGALTQGDGPKEIEAAQPNGGTA